MGREEGGWGGWERRMWTMDPRFLIKQGQVLAPLSEVGSLEELWVEDESP